MKSIIFTLFVAMSIFFIGIGKGNAEEHLLIKVQKGDSVAKIAKKAGVSFAVARDLNKKRFRNLNLIRPGEMVLLPGPVAREIKKDILKKDNKKQLPVAQPKLASSDSEMLALGEVASNIFESVLGKTSLAGESGLFLGIIFLFLSLESFGFGAFVAKSKKLFFSDEDSGGSPTGFDKSEIGEFFAVSRKSGKIVCVRKNVSEFIGIESLAEYVWSKYGYPQGAQTRLYDIPREYKDDYLPLDDSQKRIILIVIRMKKKGSIGNEKNG